MNPGQYALYPHFRSDGWLYFLVRDINAGGGAPGRRVRPGRSLGPGAVTTAMKRAA